jgi:hypothetical protein
MAAGEPSAQISFYILASGSCFQSSCSDRKKMLERLRMAKVPLAAGFHKIRIFERNSAADTKSLIWKVTAIVLLSETSLGKERSVSGAYSCF